MPTLIFTGQHPLDPAGFDLAGFPALHLGCAALPYPPDHAEAVCRALRTMIGGFDMFIVQGDTSSALGAARAAAAAKVPLAHVEAGLRSHDRQRPWPEEDFRIEIDAAADLLFAPTELSAANLRRERVRGEVHLTGNTSIDAALAMAAAIGGRASQPRDRPSLLVTCHRRESWGEGLAAVAKALRMIATRGSATVDFLLHPRPETAAQMRALLQDTPGVRLLEPLTYRETIAALLEADTVLTDSGGIQEECAALGVPAMVLRERTERPEAIACGGMALVGLQPDQIVAAVTNLQAAKARPRNPYGDGNAAIRIADLLCSAVGRSLLRQPAKPVADPVRGIAGHSAWVQRMSDSMEMDEDSAEAIAKSRFL